MKYFVVFSILLFGGLTFGSSNENEVISGFTINKNEFAREYLNYHKTGVKTAYLTNTLKHLKFPVEARTKEISDISPENQDPVCSMCSVGLQMILIYLRMGASNSEVAELAYNMCIDMQIQHDYVCRGLIDINIDTLAYIFRSHPTITTSYICAIVFQGAGCAMGANDVPPEWSINIDPNGTPSNGSKSLIPDSSDDDITIVHITDTHYDPKYQPGALGDCGAPACCRIDQGKPEDPDDGAGYWGDYRDCDSPWEAVWDVFMQINRTHPNVTYVYYTGDVIDHGVWETTIDGNAAAITKTFRALTEAFPNIPIFPLIGNHEPHPVNQFAPDLVNDTDLSSREFFRFIADEWSDWLPSEARDTIEQDGYYTVTPREGFRIIAINNNDCFTYNFWLLYNSSYSALQLQWLHDTLLEAEKNEEKVHILAHVPAGEGDCFRIWSREFGRIVNRFWNTISGQFNGHTHRDEFNIFYSRESPSDAINVAWNGGSATPFSFVNPNYRIYTVETETYQVIDHETWIYNLTEANLNASSSPNWFQEYTFSEAYNVTDLSPASLDELMTTFATDPELLTTYFTNKVKNGDPSLNAGCDNACLARLLTELVTTEFGARNPRRDELLELFWETVVEESIED